MSAERGNKYNDICRIQDKKKVIVEGPDFLQRVTETWNHFALAFLIMNVL